MVTAMHASVMERHHDLLACHFYLGKRQKGKDRMRLMTHDQRTPELINAGIAFMQIQNKEAQNRLKNPEQHCAEHGLSTLSWSPKRCTRSFICAHFILVAPNSQQHARRQIGQQHHKFNQRTQIHALAAVSAWKYRWLRARTRAPEQAPRCGQKHVCKRSLTPIRGGKSVADGYIMIALSLDTRRRVATKKTKGTQASNRQPESGLNAECPNRFTGLWRHCDKQANQLTPWTCSCWRRCSRACGGSMSGSSRPLASCHQDPHLHSCTSLRPHRWTSRAMFQVCGQETDVDGSRSSSTCRRRSPGSRQ
mmetsp:Transcript_61556/g.129921  ORF Transcript_61556/g.129921 Transcript_61556/m.129921 type:complete len:307 (-) Transcript_61556:881-1801(-)